MSLRALLARGQSTSGVAGGRCLSSEEAVYSSASTKEEELEKFRDVAWWDREGKCRPLHQMNPIRCSFIRKAALHHFGSSGVPSERFPLQNKTVLDVGCGGGILSEALGRFGGSVLGIDVVPHNIQTAQSHSEADPFLTQTIKYECVSAEALVERGDHFDLVVASEVIEHVKDPARFLKTLSQLMHPHGLLCLTTLNRTLHSLVGAIWVAEYIMRLIPQGTHEWKAFLTPEEMVIAARKADLKLDVVTGMQWNLFTEKWRFSEDTSINYAAAFSKADTLSE